MLRSDNRQMLRAWNAPVKLSFNVFTVVTLLFLSCCTPVFSQKKMALIAGISNYKPGSGWRTISSVNDIAIISNMLKKQGFEEQNIHIIKEENATKAGIVNGLKQLAADARSGDIIYFHFSGHGQQIFDDNGDEEDGYDEALVTWDAPMRYNPNLKEEHLRDDLLDTLFTTIRKKIAPGGQLVVSLDECHSGTGARAGLEDKLVKRGTNIIYAPPGYYPTTKATAAAEDFEFVNKQPDLSPIVILSACGPQEMNVEYNRGPCGSLTFALSQTFENIDSATTYRAFFDRIKAVMARIAKNQLPQIEGDIDYTIFGGKVNTAIPYYTVQKITDDKTIIINGGKLQNLSEGSVVGFYPPDTRDTTKVKPVAYGTVVLADNLSAAVKVENSKLINVFHWAIVAVSAYPFSVGYNFSKDFPDSIKKEIAQAFTSLKTVAIDNVSPDVLLQYQNKGTATCMLINTQGYTVDSLNTADENFIANLRLGILKTGQANYLRGIAATGTNDSIKVEAAFLPVECENKNGSLHIKKLLDKRMIMDAQEMNYIMKDNTYFQIKLTNKGTTKAYYTIIDIQPDDKIHFLVPKLGEQPSSYSLEPLQEKLFPVPYSISSPYGNEVLEVIASKEPVELNLIQGKDRSAAAHNNAFSQLLDAIKDDAVLSRGVEPTAAGAPVGVFVIRYKIVP